MASSSSSSSAAAETSCVRAVQFYVNKILRPRDRAKEVTGMKCLLLDRDTKGIVSMVFSMGELLQRDVFLVETLDAKHEALGHLKAVCLLRPTQANVKELCRHLREPKFLEYHVFFTNILPQDMLRSLADADHLSVVKQVQECYADFFAQAPDLFSLSLSGSLGLSRPKELYAQADELNLKRCSSGLVALLLSLKVKPYVRYLASSQAASAVAHEVQGVIGGERELFTFSKAGGSSPLLLVLDRREDPVSPLLTKWTYQAMIHETLAGGIKNNVVDMRQVKGVSREWPQRTRARGEERSCARAHASPNRVVAPLLLPARSPFPFPRPAGDMEELVLSPQDDDFFREHMNAKFPDALEAAQRLSQDYQRVKSGIGAGRSMEEIQKALDSMPEVNRKGFLASKHIALLTELNGAIEKRGLVSLGRLEQDLAAGDESAEAHLREVCAALAEGLNVADAGEPPRRVPLDPFDALRLAMLACLRYERARPDRVAEVKRLLGGLLEAAGHRDMVLLLDDVLRYAGAAARSCDLFGQGAAQAQGKGGAFLAKLTNIARSAVGGGPDMDAVMPALTRHKPLIVDLLDQLARGRLRKDAAAPGGAGGAGGGGAAAGRDAFPYVHGTEPAPGPGGGAPRFSTVVLFVVGGVTYEEAACVAAINSGALPIGGAAGGAGGAAAGAGGAGAAAAPPFRVLLGGSTILGARDFLAELQRFGSGGGGGGGGGGGEARVDVGAGSGLDLR